MAAGHGRDNAQAIADINHPQMGIFGASGRGGEARNSNE
jgi:hypothetical protein